MGLFRKVTSISTLGAVDYRSDKERIAKYSKGSRNAIREQNQILRQQTIAPGPPGRHSAAQQPATATLPTPLGPPPGWVTHPNDVKFLIWWDGARYTEHVKPVGQ
jgi:hypothetical protein